MSAPAGRRTDPDVRLDTGGERESYGRFGRETERCVFEVNSGLFKKLTRNQNGLRLLFNTRLRSSFVNLIFLIKFPMKV